jgi:hypothetical protein
MTSVLRKSKGYTFLAVSLVAATLTLPYVFLRLRGQEVLGRYRDEYQPHPSHDMTDPAAITIEPIVETFTKPHFRGLAVARLPGAQLTSACISDNLDNNTSYITSWTDAGFSKDHLSILPEELIVLP